MRINKFLASAGVASRRACEEIIKEGRVCVNNKIIQELSFQIDPQKDKVYLDSNPIFLPEENIYILLNKPKGYICSASDRFNKKKAQDLIDIKTRLFYVGRLDVNTEGLIIFTNDGDLAYKLTHPRYKIEKTYIVEINKPIRKEDIEKIKKGEIYLEEGRLLPANIKIKDKAKRKIELGIFEGKKRQIRRIFSILGYKVLDLKRISIGKIKLGKLKCGSYRYLTTKELEYLKHVI